MRAVDLQNLGDSGTMEISMVTSIDALQLERSPECLANDKTMRVITLK